MIAVPQAFFENPDISVFLRHGQNCVIRKEASRFNNDNERYLGAHAITIVHEGQLVVKSRDEDAVVVQPDEMVLLPRGIYLISDIIPDNSPFRATVFFFDENLLHSFLAHFPEGRMEDKTCQTRKSIYDLPTAGTLFLNNLEELAAAYRHREIALLKVQEFLHLMIGAEQGESFLLALQSLRYTRKQSVKAFMEQNFSLPLKIEDYAYLTGRSLSTFHRDFKRHFGVGPKSWLVDRRLASSHHRLLSDSSVSITQLAYETGYDNVSYFIRAFRLRYGISPKQLQIEKRQKATV